MADTVPPRVVSPSSHPLRGSVRIPGSKSVSQRAMVMAALADGPSTIEGVLDADDTRRLAAALQECGATIRWGVGSLSVLQAAPAMLATEGWRHVNAGDGGTPARFMMAVAPALGVPIELDGSARLRERPMADGIELIRQLGATVEERGAPGHLPVRISGRLRGGDVRVDHVASSQFISALLLVAPVLPGGLTLELRQPLPSAEYVDLTTDVLANHGISIEQASRSAGVRTIRVGSARIRGGRIRVEADASSAAYWWVASGIVPGSALVVHGVRSSSSQPDLGVHRTLCQMGAAAVETTDGLGIASSGGLRSIDVDASAFPDGALAIAVARAWASGTSRLSGLHTLRGKESDRIEAMAAALRTAGVPVETGPDWMVIRGQGWATPGAARPRDRIVINPVRDHRIAMASAVLGLCRPGVCVSDHVCVVKSYPGFWDDLRLVSEAAP